MRITLAIAAAALLQTTPGLPAQSFPAPARSLPASAAEGHLRFQRAILLPPSTEAPQTDHNAPQNHHERDRGFTQNSPTCAILPPEVFHHAAPALRDLRLLANGKEVPYAQEVSYDQQSLATGVTLPSDRSLYDTVASAPLTPSHSATSTSSIALAAQVPVERLALSAPVTRQTTLQIKATLSDAPGLAEQIRATLRPGESSAPITLGANLQHDANVELTADPQLPPGTQASLQMRRRWICFDAATLAAPPLLTYGDSSLPGPAYRVPGVDLLAHPQEAALGPLIATETVPAQPESRIARFHRPLLFAIGAELILLPLFVLWIVGRYRRSHPSVK